jgi:hypothetical protein
MDGPLPLLDLRPADDASHRVHSPGGYEWWHFDAEDLEQGLYFTANFSQGWIGNRQYAARYAAYRRHPTRRLPPIPPEYPALHWAVFRNGKSLAGFKLKSHPRDFVASNLASDVTFGNSRVFRDGEGILRLCLTAEGASANLAFHPLLRGAPIQRLLCSRDLTGADHFWVIADPLCSVQGEIRLGNETVHFRGLGYHDHHYADGPLAQVRRWCFGRILDGNSATVFQIITPRDRSRQQRVQLIHANDAGISDGEVEMLSVEKTWRPYPATIGLDQLKFANALKMDGSPLRVMYRRLNSSGAPLVCQFIDL